MFHQVLCGALWGLGGGADSDSLRISLCSRLSVPSSSVENRFALSQNRFNFMTFD